LLAFGRRANARPPLEPLLQDAAAMVAENLGVELRGVAQVVGDGTRLALRVTSGEAQGQLAAPLCHESPLSDHASAEENSMAAYALNLATPVVTLDLAAEQRFTDLFLRKLGVRSALSVPLHLNTEPFGALGVYARKQRVFTLDELSFAETMALLLTLAVARMKAEEALHEQHATSAAVLAAVDTLVMTLDAQGNVMNLNRACQHITGLSIEEIRGQPFGSVFALPNERGFVEGMLRRTVVEKMACRLQSNWSAKDGTHRHVAWSAQPIRGENGFVRSIVLIGADRSEQLERSEQLQQATAAAVQSDRPRGKLSAGANEGEPASDLAAAGCPKPPGGTCPSPESQRRHPRPAFRYVQLIAPIRQGMLPTKLDFFEVVCEDISPGGISFLLTAAPAFDDLVVALGKPPFRMYITARVLRVTEKMVDGKAMQQVGCCFTGRISSDAMSQPGDSPRSHRG
jgi:PAS domain S-box-containing protein